MNKFAEYALNELKDGQVNGNAIIELKGSGNNAHLSIYIRGGQLGNTSLLKVNETTIELYIHGEHEALAFLEVIARFHKERMAEKN